MHEGADARRFASMGPEVSRIENAFSCYFDKQHVGIEGRVIDKHRRDAEPANPETLTALPGGELQRRQPPMDPGCESNESFRGHSRIYRPIDRHLME